jgi:hypothetical protein
VNFRYFFIFFSLTFNFFYLNPAIKGSETALSIEPFYTFPAADSDNTMLGFGWFKNGFGLEGGTTSCTFDSVFPVSGDVYLNDGTLSLSADLLFRNITTWYTSGEILGNNYLVDLSSSITGLGSVLYEQIFDNTNVNINSDLIISGSVTFRGNCVFNGNGKRITLDDNGYILVDSSATVTFRDVAIDGIKDGKIACIDDTSQICFDDINWIQAGDFLFNKGSMLFQHTSIFSGAYTFSYESKMTSTIESNSRWTIKGKVKLSIGRQEIDEIVEPLYLVDDTSSFKISNCTLHVTDSGMRLTNGTIDVSNEVVVDVVSTTSEYGFMLGNGTSEGDVELHFSAGSAIFLANGALALDVLNPNFMTLREGRARIAREDGSVFYTNQNLHISNIGFDTADTADIVIASGKSISYSNCPLTTNYVDFTLSGVFVSRLANLLNANDEIYLARGTLPIATLIGGANNTIRGSGNVSGPIMLQSPLSELGIGINGGIFSDVTLAGGNVSLNSDLSVRLDKVFVGQGGINLNSYNLEFGSLDKVWTGSVYWEGSGGHVDLNSKIELSGTWTFSGTCCLNGNGNTIDLSSGGKIVVDQDSCLTLLNINLEGVSDENVSCVDDTASINFSCVNWVQAGDFKFSAGSMSFKKNSFFSGAYTFSYESGMTSTIESNSRWTLKDNIRLSMGRKIADSSDEPLYLTDDSSSLKLSNCTFSITPSGVQLTNGVIDISNQLVVDATATSSQYGLILGNGTSDGDIDMKFSSGASIFLSSGAFTLNVVNPNFMTLRKGRARVAREAASVLYVNQDLHVENVIFNASPAADMVVASGKSVSYSNCSMETDYVDFTLTGVFLSPISNLLNEDGDIFLTRGTLPLATIVVGANNSIRGGGDVSGPIMLQSPLSEVKLDINGTILNNITMAGGKVSLDRDLFLEGDKVLVGQGTVDLNSHDFKLGALDKTWTGSIYWDGSGGVLSINSKISLSGTWTFSGNCAIRGHGEKIDLSPGGKIVVDKNSSLEICGLNLEGLSVDNIKCVDGTSSLNLHNANWSQSGDFSFASGSLSFDGKTNFSGAYTFTYESNMTSTIQSNSRWGFKNNIKFVVGKKVFDSSIEPLYLADETSYLKLSNCTLNVTSSGMRLINGVVDVANEVIVDCDLTDSQGGLILGDGTADHNVSLQLAPGSSIFLFSGALTMDGTDPTALQLRHGNATIAREDGSIFYTNQDLHITNVAFDTADTAGMSVAAGKAISYSKCKLSTNYVDFTLTGAFQSQVSNLLVQNDEIYITRGTLPIATIIVAANNTIRGNGNISGPIILQSSASEVNFALNGAILTDITMGGGKISLGKDLFLEGDNLLLGSGGVNFSAYDFKLGSLDKTWTGSIYWDGLGGNIYMGSNISLSGTWTFSGACTIRGGWGVLTLEPTAEIVVERGSTLMFKETKIKNLSGNQIRCLDDSSKVIFYDSKTMLDGNFSFTVGKIDIYDKFEVHGTFTFAHQSSQPFAITPCSHLKMMEGSTFSYDPPTPNKDLVELHACLSTLELSSAALHSTSTGIRLQTGILMINGDSSIVSEATVLDEAICFGDGISAENDLTINVMPNADLDFYGYVRDQSVE